MNRLVSLCCTLLVCTQSFAQTETNQPYSTGGFYLRAGFGYATGYNGYANSQSASQFSLRSYTTGSNEAAAVGYMLGNCFGIEVEAERFKPGDKFFADATGQWGNSTDDFESLSSLVLLNPGIVLQSGSRILNVYSRLAVALPVKDELQASKGYYHSPQYTQQMRFTPGCNMSLGLSARITGAIHLWLQGSVLSLAPYIRQAVLDGPGAAGGPPGSISYSLNFRNYSGATNTWNTSFTSPMSNLAAQAGISLHFGRQPMMPHGDHVKKQLYITGGLGYSFPFANNMPADYGSGAPAPFNGSDQTIPASSSHTGFEDVHIRRSSFTSGVNVQIGAGCMFSKHVGAELSAMSVIAGRKYTFLENQSFGPPTYTVTSQAVLPLLLIPSLLLQAGGNLNVYTRLGPVLPVRTGLKQDGGDVTLRYKTMFTLGYTASIGVKHAIDSATQLWAELTMLSFEPYVKEMVVTEVYQGKATTTYVPYGFRRGGNVLANYTSTLPFSSAGVRVGVTRFLF